MTPSPTFLALDLGTTSLKGAVLEPDRMRLAHEVSAPFPAPVAGLPPGWVEVEPRAILAAARDLLDQLWPHAPHCAGLLLCGQMGGLVLTNAHGQPLTRYLSWRDQRLQDSPDYDEFRQRLTHDHRRQLGQEVRPATALSYLYWLAQRQLLPTGAIAASLPDFVAAHLCAAAPTAHPTLAAGTLNLETGDWHHAAFAALGLEAVRWPRLSEVTAPIGQVEIGGASIPCHPPVGDQQCALLGAGLAPGELSLNISTGAQASRLTPTLQLGDYQTRPYFDGACLNTVTHLPAGRALNALLEVLNELPAAQGKPLDDPWPYLEQAAAAVPATDLRVSLAFFTGAGGALTNLHAGNLTLGHLFRAAFEHLAENYHAAAQRLWPAQDWQSLVLSGGLAQRSALLRSLITHRLGDAARIAATPEATLHGLLALALVLTQRAPTAQAAAEQLRLSTPLSPGDPP